MIKGVITFSVLVLTALATIPSIVLNVSDSLPYSFFFKTTNLSKGKYLYFNTQKQWHYKEAPLPQKLIKQVVALPGDTVLIDEKGIQINGQLLEQTAQLKSFNSQLSYEGTNCLVVAAPKYNSFDSRYFGCVNKEQIISPLTIHYIRLAENSQK